MKRFGITIFALCWLVVLGWSQTVNYNFDQSVDFSKYKTYKWVEIKDSVHPDAILDKQIKAAFDSHLSQKGLSKVDGDKADLYIGYQVGVDKEKSINAYNMGGSWGYGPRWGGGMSSATTSTVNIGQLVLDMYDPSMKQIVWRGMGVKELDPKASPEKRTKNLDKGAEKILKNYPPKKK